MLDFTRETEFLSKKKASDWRLLLLTLAVWTGLEPATPCVTGMYSNQLNYQTNFLILANFSNS